jgi:hypothetical protein
MISATVSLSPYSNYASTLPKQQGQKSGGAPENPDTPDMPGSQKSTPGTQASKEDSAKAAQEQRQIEQLKKTDQTVRAHEQAHLAAAAGLATSGATFTYRRGPDGKQYAVGGEVSIDASPGRTPQETISKAERIQAAALAPADPSGQDRAVASRAAQMGREAQQELTQEKLDAAKGKDSGNSQTPASDKQKTGSTGEGAPAAKVHQGIASYQANSRNFGLPSGSFVSSTA